MLLAATAGCQRTGDDAARDPAASGQGESSAAPAYPAALSADSSPEQVARALIDALDADDMPTLVGLVAARSEAEAIDRIFRKRGREANTSPAKAARLAAAGWGATYAFCQAGKTAVERQALHDGRAAVYASATRRDGKGCTLRIDLIREDGLWKVCAGLKQLADGAWREASGLPQR
jgi:hypothetical protein